VKVGIVGLPNAGKSTLFSALTGVQAQAANYPFTTIDPNVAIVPVPDERLDAIAQTLGSTPITYETIEFHDIAGLVRGAHSGEGLGNKFLANIREVDAIVHVVRAHADPNVVHPEGRVDPGADIDTIETELVFADLEQAERRLERVVKQARSGDKAAIAEEAWLREVIAALRQGRWARTVPPPPDAPEALRNLWPLTGKPVLYVVNVGEGDTLAASGGGGTGQESIPAAVAEHAAKTGAGVVAISARIEAELAELDDEEAAAMREDLGAGESGLGRVIRAAFELLQLISFFTAGEGKEAKAYAIERGTTAQGAAGEIHSDIQKGFVRAEILSWQTLVEQGGYAGARDKGLLRIEGRDYVMQDGDVMTVRFTP
jgi:GTP-binding protein YchF